MPVSTSFVELFLPESEHALTARERAADLGCPTISAGVGAALRFLAATSGGDRAGAHSVVEVGTGTGLSGLHLLAGMAPDGILTSIDIETEYQRSAKAIFADAGIAPGRVRMINGRALEVLPRLTDAAYDLVLIGGLPRDYPACLTEALRLLRPGGMVVVAHALADGRVADPTQRDADTVAIRDTGRAIRENEELVPVLLPLGDGLLAAVTR